MAGQSESLVNSSILIFQLTLRQGYNRMEHNNLLLSDDISLSNYRSIFQYSNIVNNETDPSTSPSKETFFQKFLRYFILTLAILLIVLTFPISIWFSIKVGNPRFN